MTTTIEGVEIELGRLDTDWRKFGIRVKVLSTKKPGLKSINVIDPSNYGTTQAVINAVGVAAGACAEYLGKKYRDNIDPHKAAKNAIHAFGEECKLQQSLAAGVPAKLARVATHRLLLSDAERELLDRLQWYTSRNEPLTPFEVQALDVWAARIHANSL